MHQRIRRFAGVLPLIGTLAAASIAVVDPTAAG